MSVRDLSYLVAGVLWGGAVMSDAPFPFKVMVSFFFIVFLISTVSEPSWGRNIEK